MIQRRRRPSLCIAILAMLVFPAWIQAAQSPTADSDDSQDGSTARPGQDREAAASVPVTSTDLAKIRRALDTEPAVRIDGDYVRFYVQIVAKPLTFAEFAKGYDFVNGPTRRGNPMTHNEFLAMVTPREMHSQAGITARETLEFALTNWASQTLIKKAYEEFRNARTEREVQEIRARIERELAELRAAEGP